MRMNYVLMPMDYVSELKRTGKRKKSRAFMEYFNDMECDEHHSYGFYAKSWEVSKSTAYAWVDEFNKECQLFISHWAIRNKQHYSYAKNQAERLPNEKRTQQNSTHPKNKGVQRIDKTEEKREPNEDFNLSIVVGGGDEVNGECATDGEFNIYYSELRFIAGKYVGKKDEVYKSYKRVKKYLNIKVLVKAYKEYVKSVNLNKQEKIQGFKKFIDNDIYFAYLPKKIKVISELGIFEGNYENETLKTADGKAYRIEYGKYIDFLKNHKIEFMEVLS